MVSFTPIEVELRNEGELIYLPVLYNDNLYSAKKLTQISSYGCATDYDC